MQIRQKNNRKKKLNEKTVTNMTDIISLHQNVTFIINWSKYKKERLSTETN